MLLSSLEADDNVYAFLSLVLSEVTKILLFAAQASHHLVPPEVRNHHDLQNRDMERAHTHTDPV